MADTLPLRSIDDAPEIPFMLPADADLHAILRDARAQAPAVKNSMGMAVALRARQLETVLSDVTRQMETEGLLLQGISSGPLFETRSNVVLFANGDAHRRRRQPLARTFAFKLMEGMRGRAAEISAELIKPRLGAGAFDFVSEISAQVPARIIADILGIPRSDLPYFQALVEDAVTTLGFFDLSQRERLEARMTEFQDYVGSLLDDRRKTPRGDFLSDYAAATKESGELSEIEIRTGVIALIVAGSDTTKNSIAMTLALLLSHPDQWAILKADPDGMKKGAAAEGLRYEPVALGIPRFAVQDFELDGWAINAGRLVLFSIVSASRDPEVYANPDVFDIARTDHPRWHFAFGGGAHRCLGEALARVEIEEALASVAKLAPDARLEGAPPRMTNEPIRAVQPMMVRF
jgi:cytochrome P450